MQMFYGHGQCWAHLLNVIQMDFQFFLSLVLTLSLSLNQTDLIVCGVFYSENWLTKTNENLIIGHGVVQCVQCWHEKNVASTIPKWINLIVQRNQLKRLEPISSRALNSRFVMRNRFNSRIIFLSLFAVIFIFLVRILDNKINRTRKKLILQ